MNYFEGRKLLISSIHKKEEVVAPLFEKKLNVSCYKSTKIDTDLFGTFSGEINREYDFLETLRKKCLHGMEVEGYDLGFASEGSFGAHPFIPFANANQELTILIDKKNQLEVVGNHFTTDTNFNGKKIFSLNSALDFADNSGFPSHALVIKSAQNTKNVLKKGIVDELEFIEIVKNKLEIFESLWIETDMRACYNPTRMKSIEKSAENLIENILSKCPNCNFPGFSIVASHSGLNCKVCGSQTKSILRNEYRCKKCNHTANDYYPNGREKEDPTFCDFCNP